ncbi:MAG: sulfotransferase domain-containing protein [Myxococcota bacterium]|nr:sulfotransferase domain-containing protein [Myxococcota bacterium]
MLRRLVLGSTAPLPSRLRVRARYKWLLDLQLAQARRSDCAVVRHPKTGGTWLRVLITRLYAAKYQLPSRRVVRTDELHRIDPRVPVFLSSSGYLSWERGWGDLVATDPVLREKKLLLLARHPGDIVVSWYIQFTKRTSAFKREMMLAEMSDPIDRDRIQRWDFIQHPEIGLPRIIDYYNYWHRNLERLPDAMVVRYEDLRAATGAELDRVGAFLGESFSAAQIDDAVDFGSFDKLREKERSGYFDNRSLTLRNASDPETLKVRRGEVGGYRSDLSEEQLAWVDEQIETRLVGAYGYGGGDEPVRKLAAS